MIFYQMKTKEIIKKLESEGWVFSAVIIWLGNALTLLIALPLLTRVTPLMTAFGWVLNRMGRLLVAFG